MSETYMKLIILVAVVSMLTFTIPNSFAEDLSEICEIADSKYTYLTLTSGSDSVTVDWSQDIFCGPTDVPYEKINKLEIFNQNTNSDQMEINPTSPYTFSNLEPDTEYIVYLTAIVFFDGDDDEEYSTILEILTETIETTLVDEEPSVVCEVVSPSSMTLTPGLDSITVDWSQDILCEPTSLNYAKSHFIKIRDSNDNYDEGEVNPSNPFTFSDLQPDTEYTITLEASVAIDAFTEDSDEIVIILDTLESDTVTLTSVDDGSGDDIPPECGTTIDASGLTLTSTFDSITLNWSLDDFGCTNPDGFEIRYSISLDDLDGELVQQVAYPDLASPYTFSDLDPSTPYDITFGIFYMQPQTSGSGDDKMYALGSVITTIKTTDEETEPEDDIVPTCNLIDDSHLKLTSTIDSITASWLLDDFNCVIPDATEISYHLKLADNNGPIRLDLAPTSPFTFSNLDAFIEHTATLEIYFMSEQIGEVTNTITTDEETETEVEPEPVELKANGGGCSGDCTPPTIGLDEDSKRLVDHGFSYNNNPVDVIAWHTPYPLITAIVNQINTVEIIAFDNQGIFNLDMIQFGLGLEDLGQPLHDVEVLIEVHLETVYSENNVIVEKVVIRDSDNLIDTFSVFAVTEVVDCIDDEIDEDCLKVTLQYSYREATINNMMIVNVADKARNTQNFYFNDGVEVIGESMNPIPFVILPNKLTNQQTENLTLTLYRTDKINHIWMDGNGIEYLKVSENRFDRLTPIASMVGLDGFKINQDPIQNVMTRLNTNFAVMISDEKIRAVQHFDSSLIQGTLGDYVATAVPVHDIHLLEKFDDSIDVEQVKAQEIIHDLMNPIMIYR